MVVYIYCRLRFFVFVPSSWLFFADQHSGSASTQQVGANWPLLERDFVYDLCLNIFALCINRWTLTHLELQMPSPCQTHLFRPCAHGSHYLPHPKLLSYWSETFNFLTNYFSNASHPIPFQHATYCTWLCSEWPEGRNSGNTFIHTPDPPIV